MYVDFDQEEKNLINCGASLTFSPHTFVRYFILEFELPVRQRVTLSLACVVLLQQSGKIPHFLPQTTDVRPDM